MSDLPSYEDVLGMLAAKAGDGSVSAMIALERALRPIPGEPIVEDEETALDAILREEGVEG